MSKTTHILIEDIKKDYLEEMNSCFPNVDWPDPVDQNWVSEQFDLSVQYSSIRPSKDSKGRARITANQAIKLKRRLEFEPYPDPEFFNKDGSWKE